MTRVILFDFDGTVADSMDAAVRVANRLSEEFGTVSVTATDIERWREMPLRQVLQEANLSLWRLPQALRRMRRELRHEIPAIEPVAGMPETLRSLHRADFRLGIVTSNSRQNVEAFLCDRHLKDCFDLACIESPLFGKRRILHGCLRRYGLSAASSTYVGDETRDIEAARANGMRAIAVTWGFNTRQSLLKSDPDGVATHPSELLELLAPEMFSSIG